MIRILTTIFLATTFFITNATVFNSNTSTGNWNNGATWDQSGAIPGLHDTVIINPGHNITVTENDSCKRLVIFDDGGSQVFFNINAGDTLWVLDSVEIYDDVDASEIFININGHMEIGGNLFINTDDDGIDLSFNINPGGSLEITRTSGRNDIRAGGPGTTVSNFDFNVNGSFICHSDLRLYNQATSSGQPINFQVNDQTTLHEDLQLRIEGSTHAEVVVDVRDSISIGQDINILVLGLATDAKCRLDLDNANAYLAVAGSVGSGGIIEASSGIESTFAYNGSSSQNIRVNTNTDYHNLAIDNAAGAILDAPLNNTNFHGDMQIKNGTLDQNNHTINIIGNWTEEGTGAITQNDSITFDGTAVQNINGTVAFTNVVLFDGSNTQNINGETSFTGKVRIENTSADGVSLAASSEVTFGELEIGNLGVLKYDTAFNITGNVVDSGAVSTAEDGDTVYFSGGSAQTIFGLINFEDAVIQNSNGVTLTSGSDSISFGDLVISSGAILNPSSTNFSVSGNWTNNAGSTGFTHSNSRVRFNGPAAQSIGGTGATFFEDLLVENTFVTAPQVTVNTGCNIYGVIDVDDGQINANN
ncbi:MAG: hypothetical protein MRY83_10280, partial [Flavobacteriales bacterium]|nr:hypothetical protein [Flavobacteriales bacterium]